MPQVRNGLSDFHLHLHYKPRANNQDVDALSRFPNNISQFFMKTDQLTIDEALQRVKTKEENNET